MSGDEDWRDSLDAKLAPRALLLSGGPLDSASDRYMITFPPPNHLVVLGPIEASTRSYALYKAVSRGGFELKPGIGALTVWTVEEWDALQALKQG